MLIRVIYQNGKYDFVNGQTLTSLIELKGVQKFKRLDGWIDIDAENIRRPLRRSLYYGPERRGIL